MCRGSLPHRAPSDMLSESQSHCHKTRINHCLGVSLALLGNDLRTGSSAEDEVLTSARCCKPTAHARSGHARSGALAASANISTPFLQTGTCSTVCFDSNR